MFLKFTVLFVCLGTYNVCSEMTKEELEAMKTDNEPFLNDCLQGQGLTMDQFKELQENRDDKIFCITSCLLKKIGVFDNHAKLDLEKAIEVHKKYIKDQESLAEANVIMKECSKVNEEKVSDGDEGCDRAMMLVDCLEKHNQDTTII